MSVLKDSWSSFSREIAKIYLNGYGHPSERSKALVAAVLQRLFGSANFRLADFGCGNGHICDYLLQRGLSCEYFGYDFSTGLLSAARERHAGRSDVHFVEADIQDADLQVQSSDVVLYSHVLEMLEAPGRSLQAARRAAPLIMIRFFEPPVGEHDVVELRRMDVGQDSAVPYLRRSMSADYYNLLLHRIGCRCVDVHQVDGDKDQVHLLRFD